MIRAMRRVSSRSSLERLSGGPASPSRARGGTANGQLLSAAATLFRSAGYTASTTRQLARSLGIQSASLYYHIGKKEDLLYEISVVCLDRLQRAVEAALAAQDDPVEAIGTLIRTHLRTALADTDAHLTMLLELRSLSPRRRTHVVALRDQYEKLVRRVIASGQAAGILRADVRAKHLALALLNLVNWSIFWYQPRRGLSAEALGVLLADLFLNGARSHSTTAGDARSGGRLPIGR